MEISPEQYERIAPYLPVQRGNVSIPNLQVLNAILYVAEHGCKWRGLPPRFGKWHTVYTRMNRWSKSGVLDRVFAALQQEEILRVRLEVVALDSTSVKSLPRTGYGVHPDGGGASKRGLQAIGKSRGGWNTKLHLVTRMSGGHVTPYQVRGRLFALSPGEAHDPRKGGPCCQLGTAIIWTGFAESRLRGQPHQATG